MKSVSYQQVLISHTSLCSNGCLTGSRKSAYGSNSQKDAVYLKLVVLYLLYAQTLIYLNLCHICALKSCFFL